MLENLFIFYFNIFYKNVEEIDILINGLILVLYVDIIYMFKYLVKFK